MSITKEKKQELIQEYARDENDTGSADVQIAILTERINQLTGHLKKHKKDYSSQRGLLMLVSQRRGLLDYVKRTDVDRYISLLERLHIRR